MAHNHGSSQTQSQVPLPDPIPQPLPAEKSKNYYIHRILNAVLIIGGVYLVLKIIKVI